MFIQTRFMEEEKKKQFPKPIRCKGAVCRSSGEPLVIEEIEVAAPKAFEVRIKIICTSLCHTDLTYWRGHNFSVYLPRILGHEAIGIVESLGEGVTEVEEGDTVVLMFLPNCGDCAGCRSEKGNFCSAVPFSTLPGMPRDGPTRTVRFSDSAGRPINNLLGVSSFCEYTVVDVSQLVKLPPHLPPDKACLFSCCVSTGVGAVWKVAAVEAGSSVVVFGLGAVGLAVFQIIFQQQLTECGILQVAEGARLRGAGKIIGVDVNPDKFEIGKKMGLTQFVNPNDTGEKSLVQVIKEMTGGGADYCFECIGLASLMSDAFYSTRAGGGKTIILGMEMHGKALSIDSIQLLYGKSITGAVFGGIKGKTDIPILAKQYLDKELHLDEFVTHEVDFMDINEAFDLLNRRKCLRCMIWIDRKLLPPKC